MRKANREIANKQEILAVLQKCDVLRLGINTPDYPYVVPMNFGMDSQNGSLTLWLHCAGEGLKLQLLQKDARVGFEADCSHRLVTSGAACGYTMEYESVMGCGNITVCSESALKTEGLKAIMQHYEPGKTFQFPTPALAAVCVLRLDVMQITGKRLIKQ